MKIKLTSVMVGDQEAALQFYTRRLGFVKKKDVPMGEFRWLTVISPEGHDDVELLLEPLGFEPAKVHQRALFDAGIPATAFFVDDIDAEHKRLVEAGVEFTQPTTDAGPVKIAVLNDTCGNLIQIAQT